VIEHVLEMVSAQSFVFIHLLHTHRLYSQIFYSIHLSLVCYSNQFGCSQPNCAGRQGRKRRRQIVLSDDEDNGQHAFAFNLFQ
jgi:hypothetical protein